MMRQLRDTAELLAGIEHEWQLLIQLAQTLTDEQMQTPDAGGWTPQDNLSHVAEWMKILLGYYLGGRPAHRVIGVFEAIVRDWDMEVINPILLGSYTFGCHSFRHLVGGRLNCFTCDAASQARHGAWQRVSWLNSHHMLFAWMSLVWVGFCDFYVRMVSMGYIHDLSTWG